MKFDWLRHTPPFDRLLLLLSRWSPQFDRVLVVESGARAAADQFLQTLYKEERPDRVDILTCYGDAPAVFDTGTGRVYLTQHARGGAARKQLFQELAASRYSAVCVLCTGDPVMMKWKWMVALRIPAKVMIVNENADTFWLDRGHIAKARRMIQERMGLHRITPLRILSQALRFPSTILLQALRFPFTLAVLLAYAAFVHARRRLRI